MEERDPELELNEMANDAREAAHDLIPILVEKAINGKTKDAIHVFEALSNRSGFTEPEKSNPNNAPLINLNINSQDMAGMLSGLKTITQAPKSQIGQEVQIEKTI